MDSRTFQSRRAKLRQAVPDGALLLLGTVEAPRNYPANPYPFRQDSHFLYYAGTALPGLALLLEPDGAETLFGPDEDPDDLIWHGEHPVLADHAQAAGVEGTALSGELARRLSSLAARGVKLRYLPPYRGESALLLAGLLGLEPGAAKAGACFDLARAVVRQRSIKTADEVAQIERALAVSAAMYEAALDTIRPGVTEAAVAGAMQGVALARDCQQSFLPICSIRGEVLHNNSYGNTLAAGQLLLVDSGVEIPPYHYASDITRTFPVSGAFDTRQRGIYQAVLDGQAAAIENASPRLSNRDVHLITARTMAAGLVGLGLMRGDPEEAVAAGAHALFFPHGLGHMLGIDVHDMEDLGDVVGYPEGEQRSKQFGLSFLRLAKRLEPGFVVTVEPGIYFVPALIERWRAEQRHAAFIDYDELAKYIGFGGVRIEDDILITADGCRVLGPGIP
ncbi:MAG TPA: aminopeptidase P family protein, partial [Polyangia bacterium]|nr:aminopeptidase P family protein [Polyangia bacterium]